MNRSILRYSALIIFVGATLILGTVFVIISSNVAKANAQAGRSIPERQLDSGKVLSDTTVYLPSLLLEPTPTITISPTPTGPAWLSYVNLFRDLAEVLPLQENLDWSHGGYLHGRYMVKNDYVGHNENPANPWYTPEGLAAAQNGNVFVSSYLGTQDLLPIDYWMTAPFHAVAIIDPQLYLTGYGIYREDLGLWKVGATLDVGRGLGALPPAIGYPLIYPKPDSFTWLYRYNGGEFPDPLTSCAGYHAPTGPPIIVQIGNGDRVPDLLSHSVLRNGNVLDSCIFDETSYSNPDPSTESIGRIILNNRDAIVIMPRDPLGPGNEYSVQIELSDQNISWSFSTSSTTDDLDDQPDHQFLIH